MTQEEMNEKRLAEKIARMRSEDSIAYAKFLIYNMERLRVDCEIVNAIKDDLKSGKLLDIFHFYGRGVENNISDMATVIGQYAIKLKNKKKGE